MNKWPSFKKSKLKNICYLNNEYLWWKKMFNLTYKQKSKNWDYQWTFQNFYKKRLSIVPKNNLISNFGVWLGGSYGYSYKGLIDCYYMAIPFFGYTLLSTFLYSILIESLFKITNLNFSKI